MPTGEVWKWGYWGRRRPGYITIGVDFCCLHCDFDASAMFDINEKDFRMESFCIDTSCRMCGKKVHLMFYKNTRGSGRISEEE